MLSNSAVCFTDPEIVGVGLTPDEAKEEGIETMVGKLKPKKNLVLQKSLMKLELQLIEMEKLFLWMEGTV